MSIDDKVNEAWERAKQLYETKPSERQRATFEFDIPEGLKEVIENNEKKEELNEELKQVIMQAFWVGYYKGFDVSSFDR
ncbi:hypothetical protein CLIB1444_01S18910 [[Candida] jaroonii]|uniref:Uncharacterized protein n=1 Tax=[Candida] jaroonii TaxID=467808 RepID=A0ACA9Y232_9ASCO|nr:hypothetical protein CLIB1444_01S18910 [[Candida] jaroonii]